MRHAERVKVADHVVAHVSELARDHRVSLSAAFTVRCTRGNCRGRGHRATAPDLYQVCAC